MGALTVPAQLKAGVRYKAILEFSNPDGAKITQACFLWSGEGPYCFKTSVGGDRASTWLVTRNPNSYRLTGFLRYLSDGKLKDSNQASARIVVK